MSQKIKVDQIADLSATAAQLNFTVGVTASIQTQIDAKLPKTGGAMTGAITTNSTFDGRDVSTDGTKLDGIEAGATTDQTASEIRAKVESATDSNVFTDADHSKLNGIEASADVTDAANVTAAGALMDSEVDADIKTLSLPANTTISAYGATLVDDANAAASRTTLGLGTAATTASTDYATAAQGTAAAAALPKTGGAMTGAITTNSTFDGRDVAADGTKLDGIEASADVTDTANVVSALTAGTGITIAGNGTIASTVSGTTNASDLTSGTLPDARFPATLPAISGANLTNLPAGASSNVGTGNFIGGTGAGAGLQSGGNYNTLLGNNAGNDITTGDENVSIGYGAGEKITTGGGNIAIGSYALDARTTGTGAIAIGGQAGTAYTGTLSFVAIGEYCFYTSGGMERSVGIGYGIGWGMTSGANNTFVGHSVASGNTGGSNNTYLGYNAAASTGGAADNNVAIGYLCFSAHTTGGYNVAIGAATLQTLTTGSQNTVIGYAAGNKAKGSSNTFAGWRAGYGNTSAATGNYNVAIGERSLEDHTTSSNNTAVGFDSLKNATTGGSNTIIGYQSGHSLTTGQNNITLGYQAGYGLTTGGNNIVIGYDAETTHSGSSANNEIVIGNTSNTMFRLPGVQSGATNGSVLTYNSGSGGYLELVSSTGLTGTTTTSNTALGVSALASVTAGTNRNVAIGEKALQNVTSGTYHTAVGYEAGVGQTTGQYNTFLGTWAGRGATATGDGNVAIGYTSLGFYSRTSATRNVAIGYAALNDITTGNENIAAGYAAAEKLTTGSNNLTLGKSSGAGLTTPSSNVFLGENSGQYATTASSNICIGTYAGSYAAIGTSRLSTGTNNIIIGGYAGDKITTETNNICIGHQADNYDTGISNRITLGNSSITSLRIPGIQSGATNGQVLTYNSGSGGYLELADAGGGADLYAANESSPAAQPSATGVNAIAIGDSPLSAQIGKYSYASGRFAATGDAQGGQYILRADTTDATATVLTTNNSTAAATNQIVAASDTCITFDGTIVAMQNGAQAFASFLISGLLVNDGGTTTLANSATTVIDNQSSWVVAMTADNTNNALAITVTGEASHNIRWVANIRTSEVTYA